jgi:hypothetical protein
MKNEHVYQITRNLFCSDGKVVSRFSAQAANKRRVADDEQKTAVAVRAFLQPLRLSVFRNEMMGIMAAP